MTADTAIGIDDDLATGQAAVTLRPAHDEPSRRIDVVGRLVVAQVFRDDRADDLLEEILADDRTRDLIAMLGADDYRVHAMWSTVHVLDGHLGLAVRAQIVERVVLAHLGEATAKRVRQRDRHGHEFFGLGRRIPEHQALVARPARIYAHRDVRRLLIDRRDDTAGIGIESVLGSRIPDVADRAADETRNIHVSVRP